MDKLLHLDHVEDLIFKGPEGYEQARKFLWAVTRYVEKTDISESHRVFIKTKMDGSPSIVFGYDELGKFFVGTKSVFNKTKPKVNYTNDDIERNHADSELAYKLRLCLKYLPNVIHSGVYQGDMMYHKGYLADVDDKIYFQSNTIEYSISKNSRTGLNIWNSEIGICVHTKYHGTNLVNMQAQYDSWNLFDYSKEVCFIDNRYIGRTGHVIGIVPTMLSEAENIYQKHGTRDWAIISNYETTLKRYINHTIFTNGYLPNIYGYMEYCSRIGDHHHIEIASIYKNVFKDTFTLHIKLMHAKKCLIDTLNEYGVHEFECRINDVFTGPEGYVVIINNMPVKLVDRHVFSRLNRLNKTE